MWFDEIYEQTIIALSRMLSRLVRLAGSLCLGWPGRCVPCGLAQAFGVSSTGFDDRGINAGVDETPAGTRGFGRLIAAAHSGQIQAYLGAIADRVLPLCLSFTHGLADHYTHSLFRSPARFCVGGYAAHCARGVALGFNLSLTAICASAYGEASILPCAGSAATSNGIAWIPAIGAEVSGRDRWPESASRHS